MGCMKNLGKNKERQVVRWMLIAATWTGLSVPGLAQSWPQVVDFGETVERQIPGQPPEKICKKGQVVSFGDLIITRQRAWVVIGLGTDIILDLGSDSTVVIREELDKLQVDVDKGQLRGWLGRKLQRIFQISLPSGADLWTSGTVFEVLVLGDGSARLRVYEGEVTIVGRNMKVKQGNQVLIKPNGEPLLPSVISPWDPTILLRHHGGAEPEDPPLIELVDPRIFIRGH